MLGRQLTPDNPINQNILAMFFKRKKIKHQTAKDGQEAVEKWRTGGFHLILVSSLILSILVADDPDGHPASRHGRYRGDQGDSQAGAEQQHRCVPQHAIRRPP